MSDAYGATIAKRRLSRRLAELRTASGYTANQACDKLNWGRGKVGRFEANAWRLPQLSDVRDLLRIYSVDDEERERLEKLALLARKRQWWREYSDVFDESEYPGFEADAARICVYMPLILPGLLQTPACIDAYMRVGTKSEQWRERALEARLRRQRILERDDGTAPELVAVITEVSLLYRWGTQAERRAQMEHLVEMSRRPNVTLQLLRAADGPHPGMSSLISIFDFPGDEPSMVYLENDIALEQVNSVSEVDAYAVMFDRIRKAALDGPATTAHLKRLAETLE
ncbi:helix-turn-helix domain-containing protein [Sphaerisporangium fuscum]|uniref:helix-turn-helix domain-containing protein n=1 Tax=Sphaerisporangium fuscum TaxID=2835868 RepID=UPI001BDD86BE|nr:helix-turn-helix transcriptional regulator [Sphaerisporangium fuscum]